MYQGGGLSWFRDWRVGAVAGACLLAGFLAGMVVFGSPWHLPPAWGDVPTWLLTVLGVVAGATGLYQFRVFVRQNAEEMRRNVKRDALLDTQLAEAEARALSERRRQAEGIDVAFDLQGGPPQLKARVMNNSRRPVTDITCRIMSRTDGTTVVVPDESGQMIVFPDPDGDTEVLPETVPVVLYDTLRPGGRIGFLFNGLGAVEPEMSLVAWFTDDAGFRWQLDEYLHLVQARDGDQYLPLLASGLGRRRAQVAGPRRGSCRGGYP